MPTFSSSPQRRPRSKTFAGDVPFWACINLQERDDRKEMITHEFQRMGIDDRIHWHRPKRHPQGGRIGCFESHLEVFKAALRAGVPFAVICEDDVRFSRSGKTERAFERLLELTECGVDWAYASLQNSGGEVKLKRRGDEALPKGVVRGGFYFTRCYAITKEAMERAVATGITSAHVDVALAVANWGQSFIVRPAAVLDVPSESDNDWSEGGWGPWLAGQMQGVTHFPCVLADRWKIRVQPALWNNASLEDAAWDKFMSEPGAGDHVTKNMKASSFMEKHEKRRTSGCLDWVCCQ